MEVTLLCGGFAFAIPESAAKESPVLAKTIESLPEAPLRVIPITDFDLDAVNCFVEFLKSRSYAVNKNLFPSVIEAGIGKPPKEIPFTQDFLIRHLMMSSVGRRYEIPKLSEFARGQIEIILRKHWSDGAFLGALAIALKHTDDHDLHRVLWSQARSHLHSLTPTPEFDPVTFLKSFHSSLRACPEPAPTNSDELEKLKDQVSLFQRRSSELSIERDELEHRLSEVSRDRDERRQLAERFRAQISALQQQVEVLSKEKDSLHSDIEEAAELRENARLEAQNASTKFDQVSKKLAEANKRHTISEAEHAAKAQIAHTKLREAEKSLSTSENEVRIISSERNLLRVRWKEEKTKTSTLTKEIDDLKLAIDLERSIKDTVPVAVRDDLKQALEAEQGEVKRLNTELDKAQRSLQATTAMPQAERDRLYESLGAEKNKVVNLTRERNQAMAERDESKRQLVKEIEEKLSAIEKIEDLIDCFHDYDRCRQCGWGFGAWVEDDGDRILVRCDRCRTRHWHD
ncbi:hypothetical protein FSPOR_1886 [Fusarium sporotrichioides]|uniref:Uncharacterized protein n=1 Tax=Fusarium sporotrichioides TaxID=5514 RepID=A0A395SP10_FUSSP|nr:hypothetical protein FSPOR_1886 [Fusarium sporotrichioides]